MADLSKTTTLVNGDVFDPQVVSDALNAKRRPRGRRCLCEKQFQSPKLL